MEKLNDIIVVIIIAVVAVVVKFSESTFAFHNIKWVLPLLWDNITQKETQADWTKIVALLNLNKFVCITCEPIESK